MTFLYCFLALICTGMGIACIVIPEEMIYMRAHWRFQDCEPTEDNIRSERISGVLFIIFAIILIIKAFI